MASPNIRVGALANCYQSSVLCLLPMLLNQPVFLKKGPAVCCKWPRIKHLLLLRFYHQTYTN